MATYAEAFTCFTEEMTELGLSHHHELYDAITKHLGPSIYDNDASKVACDDPTEIQTIKTKFLIGKLGLKDGPELDNVIEQVCGALGKKNTNKHRATFYYLLVAILQKQHLFIDVK